MVFLSEVLVHTTEFTHCSAQLKGDLIHWSTGESIPSWIGVELMAQCVAAHGGLISRSSGTPPRIGLFLGSRRIEFTETELRVGQTLTVKAHRVWGKTVGMVSFDCGIEDAESGAPIAEARLNCFVPEDGTLPGDET